MGWCRLPVLLCFHGLFLRVSNESFRYIYTYIHTYIGIYDEECGSKTSSGKRVGKESNDRKELEKIGKTTRQHDGFGIFNIIHRLPFAYPCEKKRRYGRHRKMLGRPRIHNRLNYTYTCFTHIYIDESKQGPRDYVWAGRFCMEHMSTLFYYRLRTDLLPTSFFE